MCLDRSILETINMDRREYLFRDIVPLQINDNSILATIMFTIKKLGNKGLQEVESTYS
jgi:predicted MarR family transcription regulator